MAGVDTPSSGGERPLRPLQWNPPPARCCHLTISRLHVEYQLVRPPTWPSKHEGIHATSSDYLLCCKLKHHGGPRPERDFGDRSASSSSPARENRRDHFRKINEVRTQGSLAVRRRPAVRSPCQCLSPGRSCSRNTAGRAGRRFWQHPRGPVAVLSLRPFALAFRRPAFTRS